MVAILQLTFSNVFTLQNVPYLSALVHLLAWFRQATSHCMCQCWPTPTLWVDILLHSLSLVAIGQSVGWETWPLIAWHHPFVIVWSKYRLGIPSALVHYGLTWQLWIPPPFCRPQWQSHRTTSTACKGTVKESIRPTIQPEVRNSMWIRIREIEPIRWSWDWANLPGLTRHDCYPLETCFQNIFHLAWRYFGSKVKLSIRMNRDYCHNIDLLFHGQIDCWGPFYYCSLTLIKKMISN